MKQYVLFKSKKGNRYVFDRKKKKTILCHPVLYYLLELEDRGKDLKKWVLDLKGSVDIEGVGTITKKEIKYYYRKYQILNRTGILRHQTRRNGCGKLDCPLIFFNLSPF